MFKIDTLLEGFSKKDLLTEEGNLTKKEQADAAKARKLAIAMSSALMKMGFAIQGYDEGYKNLIPDAKRKPAFLKAANELKAAIEKGGVMLKDGTLYEYPEFRMDVNKWKMMKNLADNPLKMFDVTPGTRAAKNAVLELVKLATEIKKFNWVEPADTSSAGFAKDFSDNNDQEVKYKSLLSNIKTADLEDDERERTPEEKRMYNAVDKGLEELVKRTTKDAERASNVRSDYIDDIWKARREGTKASNTVSKLVDRTGVGAGVRRKGLDDVRKAEVAALKKDDSVKLNDSLETGFDFKGKHFKNVKLLVAAWKEANVPMQGQIKIISKTNRFNKPIIMVDGKLYIVPKNDIVGNARGGIEGTESPYKGYTESCTRKAEYKELRDKFR